MLSTLIDTNLLLLWIVGTTDKRLISIHKRLSMFLEDDFDILLWELAASDAIVLCPNVLTEASNLSRYIAEPHRSHISATFSNLVSVYAEDFVSSQDASRHVEFSRLGLTDAVLLTLAARGATLLTTDLDLHLAAVTSGHASVNFNFLRDQYLN